MPETRTESSSEVHNFDFMSIAVRWDLLSQACKVTMETSCYELAAVKKPPESDATPYRFEIPRIGFAQTFAQTFALLFNDSRDTITRP